MYLSPQFMTLGLGWYSNVLYQYSYQELPQVIIYPHKVHNEIFFFIRVHNENYDWLYASALFSSVSFVLPRHHRSLSNMGIPSGPEEEEKHTSL